MFWGSRPPADHTYTSYFSNFFLSDGDPQLFIFIKRCEPSNRWPLADGRGWRARLSPSRDRCTAASHPYGHGALLPLRPCARA